MDGRLLPLKPPRATIEAVIGHLKVEHRMACSHLAHRTPATPRMPRIF